MVELDFYDDIINAISKKYDIPREDVAGAAASSIFIGETPESLAAIYAEKLNLNEAEVFELIDRVIKGVIPTKPEEPKPEEEPEIPRAPPEVSVEECKLLIKSCLEARTEKDMIDKCKEAKERCKDEWSAKVYDLVITSSKFRKKIEHNASILKEFIEAKSVADLKDVLKSVEKAEKHLGRALHGLLRTVIVEDIKKRHFISYINAAKDYAKVVSESSLHELGELVDEINRIYKEGELAKKDYDTLIDLITNAIASIKRELKKEKPPVAVKPPKKRERVPRLVTRREEIPLEELIELSGLKREDIVILGGVPYVRARAISDDIYIAAGMESELDKPKERRWAIPLLHYVNIKEMLRGL